MKNVVFIGSVKSSAEALNKLIQMDVVIELVCSLDEKYSKNVSDYYPIHEIARESDIPYLKFKNINDTNVVNRIKKCAPDILFVIGLSQLIKSELISVPTMFTIGFHPTPLPRLRGRAALPWQVLLKIKHSKVTFFSIGEGMDDGDIFFTESYEIGNDDYVGDVYNKVLDAMSLAIEKNIYPLLEGSINPKEQDESFATFLLKRTPYDGIIDWSMTTADVLRNIRANSRPYPGAYSYIKGDKIIIFKAEKIKMYKNYIGYNGQIADKDENSNLIVLTNDGIIKINDYKYLSNKRINIGDRLLGEHNYGIHKK